VDQTAEIASLVASAGLTVALAKEAEDLNLDDDRRLRWRRRESVRMVDRVSSWEAEAVMAGTEASP
jgi:hypothetical protein